MHNFNKSHLNNLIILLIKITEQQQKNLGNQRHNKLLAVACRSFDTGMANSMKMQILPKWNGKRCELIVANAN